MAYDRDRDRDRDRDGDDRGRRRMFIRRKACRFCTDKEAKVDFKNAKMLSYYVTERGKIIPRRISGTCALHQRDLNTAVKRARVMAILPFTSTQR